MAMAPILQIDSIGKKYRIHHQKGGYLSMREEIKRALRFEKNETEEFWALKDISLAVQEGDTIGIIGRNGAGKSTLLKLLSRITRPTRGSIIFRGRIASLLEVGTGFHPELTGRENVFFNGALLGMRQKEIESKFDEIVDFSGVERFLDTPMKHYSSGMQLRLAFSVAAFLEPEILVIDEVLAVGDASFQRKCLGKMEDVAQSGRTILFVSHNLSVVESLCSKSVLLQNGRLAAFGPSHEVIEQYAASDGPRENRRGMLIVEKHDAAHPVKRVEFRVDGKVSEDAYMGCSFEVRVFFEAAEILSSPVLGVIFKDSLNSPLLGINNKHYQPDFSWQSTRGCISMRVPSLQLFEGLYNIDIHFGNGFSDLQVLRDCFTLFVNSFQFTDSGSLPDRALNKIFIKDVVWEIEDDE